MSLQQSYCTCQTTSSPFLGVFYIVSRFLSVPMTNQAKRVECSSTAVCPLPALLVKHLRHREVRERKKNTVWLNIDRGVWMRDEEVSEIRGKQHSMKESPSVSTVGESLKVTSVASKKSSLC